MKRAFTLIELLVVIAIIAILAAILFPVFARAREKGKHATCISNLHQIGLAIAMYRSDYSETNPRHRFCPDRVGDELCTNLQNPTEFTGPQEVWWAPYDNSVPTDSPGPYPNYKKGFLQPYVKSVAIFKCPSDPIWQVGYAMSYVTDGPMGRRDSWIRNPSVFFVWDHARTPGCADTRAGHQGPPWTPFPPEADTAHTHYPFRHSEGFTALKYDGATKYRKPSSLRMEEFIATRTPE